MIDRVPEELWTEVHDIVQEAVIKTIPPQKKKYKKVKWLSEEALQIAEKRREIKGKGENERYTHLNAEFQEQQGEIRKLSSVISAKKQRKTTEWERLDQRSLQENQRYQGNMSFKDGLDKGQKWRGPSRSRRC